MKVNGKDYTFILWKIKAMFQTICYGKNMFETTNQNRFYINPLRCTVHPAPPPLPFRTKELSVRAQLGSLLADCSGRSVMPSMSSCG